MVGFRVDWNIEIVGSGPEDIMFDAVPRSNIMRSLSSDTSATGAGKKIKSRGVIFWLEVLVSYDLKSSTSNQSRGSKQHLTG